MNPELDRKLRYLRLSGMAAALEARNQEAIHHHLAFPEFLELLVEDEMATRRDRLFARRLKQAGIMEVKSLDAYDYVQCPVMWSGGSSPLLESDSMDVPLHITS